MKNAAKLKPLPDHSFPSGTQPWHTDAAALLNITLPHNKELEQAVLGACLLDYKAFGTIRSLVTTEEVFYENKHQTVFMALERLHDRNQPIDMLTVSQAIREMGFMELSEADAQRLQGRKARLYEKHKINTYELVAITNSIASSAHLQRHTRIIYELYMRRKAITDAFTFVKQAQDLSCDIFELYDFINRETRVTNPSAAIRLQKMNDVMLEGQQQKPSKMLIGNLVKENEVAIIFGDEGTGKSILAFQMGEAISTGQTLFNLEDDDFANEAAPKRTIFFDFELQSQELYQRYSHDGQMHFFHENFTRASISPEFIDFDDADDRISNEIQAVIEANEPEFVIIDNITYITSESQDPAIASKLMKKLLGIQKRFAPLSILVIAHTPKRDMSMPIESRHLAGAKNLSNFCHSLIAVSPSKKDPYKRYIKHLKCRNGAKIHGEDNVIEAIVCANGTFLGYEFVGYGSEQSHLHVKDFSEIESSIIERAAELHKQGYQGARAGWRKIAEILKQEYGVDWSHTTVSRKVKKWLRENDLSAE